MTSINTWATETIEAAHIEDINEKASSVNLAPADHLEVIITLFPLLPEICQRVVRMNVEALASLAV